MKALFCLLALALAGAPALANETNVIYNDQIELGDIASPEEIYSEMLNEGFAPQPEIETTLEASNVAVFIHVNKAEQRVRVWENGAFRGEWAVSTGTETEKCAPTGRCYIAHTPVGTWTPTRLEYTYTSRLWNARMDRAIFFTGGIALHATFGENIRYLGRRASGGCIRQHPDNADYLFRLVSHYGRRNTRVQVSER